jgi:hypothetical protein
MFEDIAQILRVLHQSLVLQVFVLIEDRITEVGKNHDVQIVIDILDRFFVIENRRREVAVIRDSKRFDDGDHVIPTVFKKERNGRFPGIPDPAVAFDDFGFAVGDHDFLVIFEKNRDLIPNPMQGLVMLVTLKTISH